MLTARPQRIFVFLLSFVACVVYASVASSADWQAAVKEGDELYNKRYESNGEKDVNASIKKYEEALKGIPESDEKAQLDVYIKLSRANFTLADVFAKEDEAEAEFSNKGQDWAKKALDIDDDSAAARYWMGANLGVWRGVNRVSFRGGLGGGGIMKEFEKAAKLDPKGLDGMPYMRMGEFSMAKSNLEEAKKYAEEAVKIQPKLLKNKLILAEALWKNEDKADSKKLLEDIASQPDNILPNAILENRVAIEVAKRVLQGIAKGGTPDW
ncbi:MAG: tetratricopeptide repeat protein [Planctomycetota bacterium]|jgi:tetratricopeptide (TPR) repeat protein